MIKKMATNKDKKEYYCQVCRSWFLKDFPNELDHYTQHLCFIKFKISELDINKQLEEDIGSSSNEVH